MTDTPGTPLETTPGTPPAGGATGGTPLAPSGGKTAAQLEAEYKGLQTSYNKMKEASDKAIADATVKLQEAQATIEELKQSTTTKDSQLTTLTQGADALKQQLETLKSEKGTAEGNLARAKLIMGDFPELAVWEAQGLIPKGSTDEETKQILTKFRETMTGQIGVGVKSTLAGATPPGSGQTNLGTPPGGSDENEQYLMDKMLETAGRDEKAFKEWQAKYDAVQAKKALKTS